MDARTHTDSHTRTQTPVVYQGNETEERIFKKRKVFKEDLKELTEVEWRTMLWLLRHVCCSTAKAAHNRISVNKCVNVCHSM